MASHVASIIALVASHTQCYCRLHLALVASFTQLDSMGKMQTVVIRIVPWLNHDKFIYILHNTCKMSYFSF